MLDAWWLIARFQAFFACKRDAVASEDTTQERSSSLTIGDIQDLVLCHAYKSFGGYNVEQKDVEAVGKNSESVFYAYPFRTAASAFSIDDPAAPITAIAR